MEAYATKDLQQTLGLLRAAQAAGRTIEQVASAIDAELRGRVHPASGSVESRPEAITCPTPGCPGLLTHWPHSSREAGVPIIGCRLCHYSRMEGRP